MVWRDAFCCAAEAGDSVYVQVDDVIVIKTVLGEYQIVFLNVVGIVGSTLPIAGPNLGNGAGQK